MARIERMSETTFIYALVDPRDARIRYVGKSRDPELRTREHIGEQRRNKGSNNFFRAWLRQLGWNPPPVLILEEVIKTSADRAERWWIASLKSAGFNLANLHPGGTGGPTMTGRNHKPETIMKMRAVALANRENRARAGASRINRASIWKGRRLPDATKRKMSETARGRYRDPATGKWIKPQPLDPSIQ